jgi:tetratricopeptide (TPR) repeat protein
MDFTEQLRILQAAQGNPALLALATVDLAHNALAAEERTRIKDALVAAAVPHWCDRDFLAALLDTTPEEGERLLGQLRALTVVEPFPARGEHAVNVHEAARLALREHLRATDVARWKALSTRARAHVCQGTEPHTRIEALYHLFAINQPAAAAACEALDREFTDGGRPEVRHALALALRELTDGGWLTESAQVEALLAPLMVRHWRGEAAQLEAEARYIADLARTASDPSGIGRTQLLLGDVLQTKGRLDEALAAFREALAISQRLASTDSSNTDWQRDLADAHDRVGVIFQAQGRLDEALAAFREALAIFQRLASTDPSNAGWQRDLAVAHAKVGDILQTQGRLDEALAAFREAFAIFQRLASLDPSNADWQRDLGVTHDRVGDILQAQGRLDEALATFREAFAISQRLASTEPSNANWQRDLAIAHSSLGQAYQSMGNEKNAQSSYRSAVDAMEQAVAMSPGNVGWKQDLDNLKSWLSSGGGSLHE